MLLKPSYFKKQHFSSSFLLTWSKYTGPNCHGVLWRLVLCIEDMELSCGVLHGHFRPAYLQQVSKMMMKNVVSRNDMALKRVPPLTYLQGNCSDCKLIASKQKSVLLLFTLTWSPRLVYSSRMANLIERQRQKSDTQKFLSWRWYTIGLNLYEVACQMLYDYILLHYLPWNSLSWEADFFNPGLLNPMLFNHEVINPGPL